MTYAEFKQNFLPEFRNIKSFNGKVKYAREHLGTPIGSGTGRIVFNIDGEKVLKLAKNTKGIAQNEAEANAGYYHDTQDIVAIIFDSEDDNSWLISEFGKKVNEKRIVELTGIPSLSDLYYYVRDYEASNRSSDTFKRYVTPEARKALDNNEFANLLTQFIANYAQHPGDYGRPNSYGEVLRGGQPTIVLTDYGLNDEVYDTHYSGKSKHHIYELYNFADGNDDILSDIGNTGEIRHGMWGLMPYSVGDGDGVINEDFISFVLNRDKYPTRTLPSAPYILDEFHDVVNNLKEVLSHVDDKKKFYNNLLELQNYLIRGKFYDREPLEKQEVVLNEDGMPTVERMSLTKEYAVNIANEFVNKLNDKLSLGQPNFLGGESNGFAFNVSGNRVLKLTTDASEIDAGIKIHAKPATYLANVYQMFKIFDTANNKALYILIEDFVPEKPKDLFAKYENTIIGISDDLFANLLYLLVKGRGKKRTEFEGKVFDDLPEMSNLILTQNPEANISNADRQASHQFMLGLYNIKKELLERMIPSNDFLELGNLGYKNKVLTYFDVGGYPVDEPEGLQQIDLPENAELEEDGSAKFSTDNSIGSDDFPAYNQDVISPSINNNLNPNSSMYEDLEYSHVDDATQDEFILNERDKTFGPNSKSVEVKQKCRLAGNGNTSTACNQGDISNLNIKSMNEADEDDLNKKVVGTYNDGKETVKVIAINGNKVRSGGFIEWVDGGHYYVDYKDEEKKYAENIPEDEIWVDDVFLVKPTDFEAILLHERIERFLMKFHGLSYDDAHVISNKVELFYRKKAENIHDKEDAGRLATLIFTAYKKKYNEEHKETQNEGVGDTYAEKQFNIPTPHADFNTKYSQEQNKEVLINGKNKWGKDFVIIKNPKSPDSIGVSVRGVIDADGNLFVEQRPTTLHSDILKTLNDTSVLPNDEKTPWHLELPTNFITVQRHGNSNIFLLGESNQIMFPDFARGDEWYWEGTPTREQVMPVTQMFLDKAKQKNPSFDFINELETYYGTDLSQLDDNNFENPNNSSSFVENKQSVMGEAQLMSLQDLPFKKEVEELGGKIFSVGGAVRDVFLGKESKDLDILISGIPFEQLEQILSKYGRVDAVGKSYGILKFKPKGETEDIDIAIPRTEKATGGGGHQDFDIKSDHTLPIEKDLERRDFTINAIAKDVEGNIIDPYNGQEDLKNKIIRAVNPEAFSDDPLRMLRAVQFASRFGFTIEPNTMKMIQNSAEMIKREPSERILTEFGKIVEKGKPAIGAQLLIETGLFQQIFGKPKKITGLFNNVKTMAEFIFLLSQGTVENPAEFYLNKFSDEDAKKDKKYKEIKALMAAYDVDSSNPVAARSVAHNVYSLFPTALQSQILPDTVRVAAQELLSGKYPKTVNDLAVNGNDLTALGLKGKEIGDAQKMMLLKIYSDKVDNDKKHLITLVNDSNVLNESNTENNSRIEYGCLMLFLDVPIWNKITSVINKEDVYKKEGYGIDNEPHVTILYGFHDEVTDGDVFDLYKKNIPLKPININITGISIFENPEFDVVKFDVDSDLLAEINKIMQNLPNTKTFAGYHPHITIAYVKKGEGKKYVKKFEKNRKLSGNELVYTWKGHKGNDGKKLMLDEKGVLNENKKTKYDNAKESLMKSKSISKEMKEKILPYIGGGSTYHEGGRLHGLIKPKEFTDKTPKSSGVSLGADKDGFFCYTHRAASKRHESPEKIPVKEINFIETTG